METPIRKKGGKKRPHVKNPSLHSYATAPEWLTRLPSLASIEPANPSAFQFAPLVPVAPMRQPEKSFGELLGELVIECYKAVWKKASPGSYVLNRTIYAVAPYCGPAANDGLNLGALITFGYGLKQIVNDAQRRSR